MRDTWLAGEFVGDYVGEPSPGQLPLSPHGARGYRIEIVRGVLQSPRAGRPSPSTGSIEPLYQPALQACYFKVVDREQLLQCPLYEIELHAWRRVNVHENGNQIHGRIHGTLYG